MNGKGSFTVTEARSAGYTGSPDSPKELSGRLNVDNGGVVVKRGEPQERTIISMTPTEAHANVELLDSGAFASPLASLQPESTKSGIANTTIKSEDTEVSPKEVRHAFPIKKILVSILILGVLAAGGLSGYQLINHIMAHQETDDAYTTGHQHQISSRINATVEKVLVDDNQHVKKGQVLAILDPRDFEVKVAQAKAKLELSRHQAEAAKTSIVLSSTTAIGKSTEAEAGVVDAEATVQKAEAALLEARASVPKAEADLRAKESEEKRAKMDGKRFINLAGEGAVSLQQRDAAIRDFEVAKSAREAAQEMLVQSKFRLEQANQAVKSAKAQVFQSKGVVQQAQATHVQTQVNERQYAVAQASIHEAEAQLQDAELQLSYTKVVAPVDGRVGKKIVEAGQRIQPGQQLMTVVADDVWIVANFKETQLENMRPNQEVEIKIDSYPHHKFYGTIDSVSPGSGATFALLPPDNATGNFTKIVQRIPVKIRFDKSSVKGFENLLVPGMSANVSVDVQPIRLDSSSALASHKVKGYTQQTVNVLHKG